jgi:anti-anti-sigma factor
MTGILSPTADTLIIAAGDLHELVRGQERELVERLAPLVRRQNITLDLCHVERIDAAGISALISLYGMASSTGNEFSVVNASARVAEILGLVGLDRILISNHAVPCPRPEPCFERPAA